MSDTEKEPSGLSYKLLKAYGGFMDTIHYVEKPKTAAETPWYGKLKTYGPYELDPCIHPERSIETHYKTK